MRVPVGDLHAFVSHTVANGNGRIAHVDKQGNVAVSQIVDSDDLDARRLASELHAALQGMLGQREDAAVRFQPIKLLEIVLYLVAEKVRHLDHAVAFLRFRRGDNVFALQALIGFIDAERFLLKIKVRRRQRQQLTLADAAPIQDFKCVVQHGLIHHGVDEFEVFFLRPEQNFLWLFAAHIPGFRGGIDLQAVILDGMVENAAQLRMDVLEIVRGIGFAA